MFTELAATIISAAGTESSAASGQLPQAVQQLVVDLTDELLSNAASHAKLSTAWNLAAAAVMDSGSPRLPVVAAVKLLCRQLVASEGLRDIRLLGWLVCLVREQHLAVQLTAAQGGSSSSRNNGTEDSGTEGSVVGGASDLLRGEKCSQEPLLSAEIDLARFCEVLLLIVQGLLPAEDAALVEDIKHHQQQQQHVWHTAAAAAVVGTSNRRARIVFDGSTPTPSDCSPAWGSAEQLEQKWDEGLRALESLNSIDQVLGNNVNLFQPSQLGKGSKRIPP